ncbi:MAG: hypothetical protein K2H84_01045 [Paramuribaculum sp.]|nr:hypothetical protein [Paramuribaculum sp.]MDE6048517.1 hypothetical protein [Paramuribaculum sp.]
MKRFIIWGESDAGKTTTCIRMYNVLKSMGATVLYYEIVPEYDFKAVLMLNNTKICIYSAGDAKGHLIEAIQFGANYVCDILIGVISYYKHHNEALGEFREGEDFEWRTLTKFEDIVEKDFAENKLVMNLLNEIWGICLIVNRENHILE